MRNNIDPLLIRLMVQSLSWTLILVCVDSCVKLVEHIMPGAYAILWPQKSGS